MSTPAVGSALAGSALVYYPRRLAVGIGCERGVDPEEAIALVRKALDDAGLALAAVALVASLDLKADEPAVLLAAERFGVPARFFTAARLEEETPRLKNPSDTVFREVGCHGVAEGAALAAAGPDGALIVPKRMSARVTCAIAEAPEVIDPTRVGRARGRLAIVGIGPGSAEWLTPEARRLLQTSDAVVGYSLYLDLVAPFIAHAERFDSPLGAEEERVRRALALAAEGRSVALVSSGDAGIYAMASLVFECLEPEGTSIGDGKTKSALTSPLRGGRNRQAERSRFREGVPALRTQPPSRSSLSPGSDPGSANFDLPSRGRLIRGTARETASRHASLPGAARRVEIVVAPGISAMQAAAARAGAPLGHDFCAISLSDLLTPWGTIEARIRAAAEGDFVIAFYNPVSQRRRTQLMKAKDILLRHRPPDTPVVVARNIGREGERMTTVALADLAVAMVDMLTLVIVGASTTRNVEVAGRAWAYTPRGYGKRRERNEVVPE